MHFRVRIGACFICAVLANLDASSVPCTQPRASNGDDVSLMQTSMSKTLSDSDNGNIGPMHFLIMSSPSLQKIVWTRLFNGVAENYEPFALITSGLEKPMGVAVDSKNGFLYVADMGEPAIYQYTLELDTAGGAPTLLVNAGRLVIQSGHPVEWLALDDSGGLFYTAPDSNNINKISADVVKDVSNGRLQANMLRITSEKTLELQSTRVAASNNTNNSLPTNAPLVQPEILSIYEAKYNPHVSTPAGMWIEGPDLYWTNTKDGTKAGVIVKGEVDPAPIMYLNTSDGPLPFPAEAITKSSSGAFDMAKIGSIYYFTQNGTQNGPSAGLVSAFMSSIGDVVDITYSLNKPRGLAWDGDMTLFVADEDGGKVWSFPAGRFMANPPLTLAVRMQGVYSMEILRGDAPFFQSNRVSYRNAPFDVPFETSWSYNKGMRLSRSLQNQWGSGFRTRGSCISILLVLLTVGCALGVGP